MPGWKIKESPTGDVATFNVVCREVIIDGLVKDCDGDYVEWLVKENGNVIKTDSVRRTPEFPQHEHCWNEAIRQASIAIMTDPHPRPQKARDPKPAGRRNEGFERRDDAKSTGENKKVKVYKGFDELPLKGTAKKGKGRERGERRDKWADA